MENLSNTRTTLDNCETEPIHIPGAIQPHGVLLVLDPTELKVRQASANAREFLGKAPSELFGRAVEQVLDEKSALVIRNSAHVKSWKRINPITALVDDRRFDAIVHRSAQFLVVELEPFDIVPQGDYRDYVADAHAALLRLQGSDSLPELLQSAAEEVRRITGYDRVMIYQFAEDLHGQVVAEDKLPSLEPFLGLHYPASDIPAQARRLYLLNWLRIIADINYQPAALAVATAQPQEPLDLSFSVLRSVSPIHIEYLWNMGVGASMSVSLIHQGKLWGLIACHHYSPRFVPFSVRMTCELMGQTLSTLVASHESAADAAKKTEASLRRAQIVERLASAEYIAQALIDNPEDLLNLTGSTGVAILESDRLSQMGSCPSEPQIRSLAKWFAHRNDEFFVTDGLKVEHPDAPDLGTNAAGVLAIGFPIHQGNMVIWFRPEHRRTISWAGTPEKKYQEGPNGPRLSPRGSFALWTQQVQNRSEPWSSLQIETAKQLRNSLVDAALKKAQEVEQARDMLLGMVSHDLRNPLGAISLSAKVLKAREPSAEVTRVSARIAASSDRMTKMVEQLVDFTRTRAGKFELERIKINLVELCRQLAEEIEAAHPGTRIVLELSNDCEAMCDPDRLAQAISNLLSNARHYGAPDRPITLRMNCTSEEVTIEVHNFGRPIPEDQRRKLFEPFHQGMKSPSERTRQGLGLGLYIVERVADAHGGRIAVRSDETGTTFSITLPRGTPA